MSLVKIRKDIIINGLNMQYGLMDINMEQIDALKKEEAIVEKKQQEEKKNELETLQKIKSTIEEYNMNLTTYNKKEYKKEYKEYRKNYYEMLEFLKKTYKWDKIDFEKFWREKLKL